MYVLGWIRSDELSDAARHITLSRNIEVDGRIVNSTIPPPTLVSTILSI